MMKAAVGLPAGDDLDIISAFFEAAADHTRLVSALELLCRRFGASSATLITPSLSVAAGGMAALFGGTPLAIEAYQSYYHERDIWLQAALRKGMAGAGTVVTGEMLVSDGELLASEFYTDFLRPQGQRWMLGATIADGADQLPRTMLTLLRSDAEGGFDDAAADHLRRLVPHLRRALAIHQHIGNAAQRQAALEAALSGLGFGVILATAESDTVFANQIAHELLKTRDGIIAVNGTLTAADAVTARELQAAIQRAAGVAAGRGGPIGAALRLPRNGDSAPFTVIVAPLKTSWPTAFGKRRPCVAVFLFGLEGGNEVPLPALMAAFNLTRSEARVLNLLTDGYTVNDVAKQLGVTTNTVRTHLKHLFQKMGCSRQSDAIRLSLSMRAVTTETAEL